MTLHQSANHNVHFIKVIPYLQNNFLHFLIRRLKLSNKDQHDFSCVVVSILCIHQGYQVSNGFQESSKTLFCCGGQKEKKFNTLHLLFLLFNSTYRDGPIFGLILFSHIYLNKTRGKKNSKTNNFSHFQRQIFKKNFFCFYLERLASDLSSVLTDTFPERLQNTVKRLNTIWGGCFCQSSQCEGSNCAHFLLFINKTCW